MYEAVTVVYWLRRRRGGYDPITDDASVSERILNYLDYSGQHVSSLTVTIVFVSLGEWEHRCPFPSARHQN